MEFTIEQLEKIINEAPDGAQYYTPGYDVEYRKITGRNAYYGFVDTEWMGVLDKSLSIERINKGFSLVKLAEQLQEMKMKEEVMSPPVNDESINPKEGEWWLCTRRSPEVVAFYFGGEYFQESKADPYKMDTAMPIERLYTQAELDAAVEQSGNSEEFKNGNVVWDITHHNLKGVFVGSLDNDGIIECSDDNSLIRVNMRDLSKVQPLSPEQKQAQIDEENGELYFNLMSKVSGDIHSDDGYGDYSSLCQSGMMIFKQTAKIVDFPGKLSA